MASVKKLFIFIPLLATVLLIYLAVQFNRGELIIDGAAPFTVSFSGGSTVFVEQTPYKKSLWASEYQVTVRKDGYNSYSERAKVKRGKEVIINPVFTYIPVLRDVFDKASPKDLFIADNALKSVIPSNWQDLAIQGEDKWPSSKQRLTADTERVMLAPGLANAIVFHEDGRREWYKFSSGKGSIIDPLLEKFAWSPDGGSLLAFGKDANGDNILKLLKAAPAFTPLTTLSDINGLSFIWSPQGDKFAFIPSGSLQERNIYLFDLKSGRKDKLTSLGNIVALKWDMKGQKLLYETITSGSLKPELHVFDIGTSEDRQLLMSLHINKVAWLNDTSLIVAKPSFAGSANNSETEEESSLAEVLDKLAKVKTQISTGVLGQIGNIAGDALYRYDISAGDGNTVLIFDPAANDLVVDDIYVTEANKTIRIRDGENIYELKLEP